MCTFVLTFGGADGRWLLVHSASLIGHLELTEFALSQSLKRCKQRKVRENRLNYLHGVVNLLWERFISK